MFQCFFFFLETPCFNLFPMFHLLAVARCSCTPKMAARAALAPQKLSAGGVLGGAQRGGAAATSAGGCGAVRAVLGPNVGA